MNNNESLFQKHSQKIKDKFPEVVKNGILDKETEIAQDTLTNEIFAEVPDGCQDPNEVFLMILQDRFISGTKDERKKLLEIVDEEEGQRLQRNFPLKEKEVATDRVVGVNFDKWPKVPLPELLLGDIFARQEVVMMSGASKIGKSRFMTQMAVSIAGGRNFLGWNIPTPHKVMYYQYEIQEGYAWKRFKDVEFSMALGGLNNNLEIYNALGYDFVEKHVEEDIENFKPDVIIFDPLYMLLDGDENKAEDVLPRLKWFGRMARKHNCTVLYVHHTAKGHAGDRPIMDRYSGTGQMARFFHIHISLVQHKDDDKKVVEVSAGREKNTSPPFSVIYGFNGLLEKTSDPPVMRTSANSRNNDIKAGPEDALDILPDEVQGKLAAETLLIASKLFKRDPARAVLKVLIDDKKLIEIPKSTSNGPRILRKSSYIPDTEPTATAEMVKVDE